LKPRIPEKPRVQGKKVKVENTIIEAIQARRSIREFSQEPVSDEVLDQILESALWAPSGKNNQPWKFAVIRDSLTRRCLAALTHYGAIIRNAPACIAVFLDHSRVYDRTKDVLAVGASTQNMLLTIHSLGLGGVWLGEILKSKEKVSEVLGAEKDLELMAVVALGYRDGDSRSDGHDGSRRRDRLGERVFLRK
jgi:nitroreductase